MRYGQHDSPLRRSTVPASEKWGFKPLLCDVRSFNSFGGSFHCATLDVRRRGGPPDLLLGTLEGVPVREGSVKKGPHDGTG